MLRNLKLGTKLLAVVLPPLIVLVIVAGLGATDRLDEAGDARSAEQYIELATRTNALVSELQRERTLSVFVLSGGSAEGDPLGDQRELTDSAWSRFEQSATEVRGDADPALVQVIDRASGRQSELNSFRQSINSGATDAVIIGNFFNSAIGDFLNVATEVSNNVPVIEVSADLTSYAALLRAQEAFAQNAAVFTEALTLGTLDENGRTWRGLLETERGLDRYQSLYYDVATAEQAADLRRVFGSAEARELQTMREDINEEVGASINWLGDGASNTGDPVPISGSAIQWMNVTDQQLVAMAGVAEQIQGDVLSLVSDVRTDAEQAALLYLLVTAAAVVISILLAVVVARRVTKPLRNLTEAADKLSGEQIPALVERLRNPSAEAGEVIVEPINMSRSDEIGHLADAFDSIQRVTVEVAEEQASLLRKGIGDIFVNLARRNQTLLDRQIEFIDQLESAEEDPDVLENLFKLDHLATRMRRNAESLLVLAGIETGHRRSRPVPLADVVRVAIGEVEDFARLNLLSLDDSVVSGTAAMDVAHLLSELMENATSFSPPETKVEILGHANREGGYVISISDQGIGMSDEQFAEANRLLAEPPLVGLTLSRSLGFTVVGRLAKRFDISVRLTSSPTGGVTALVTLPESVLQAATISVEPTPAVEAPASPAVTAAPEPIALEGAEADRALGTGDSSGFAPPPTTPADDWVAPAPATASLASAVPEGAAFDAGLAALMGEEPSESTSIDGGRPATATDQPVDGPTPPPAETAAGAGSDAGVTAAGLVKRVPRASTPSDTGERAEVGSVSVAASQRSPEEVRAMLSRYRSGLRKETTPGQSPSGSDETN